MFSPNLPNQQRPNCSLIAQYSTVYLICFTPDGRLIMYRRLLNTNHGDDRTGWTVTLRRNRVKEVDPRKIIMNLLFTSFGLKDEILSRFKPELIFEHSSLTESLRTELFTVKFDERITLRVSSMAEVKAVSEKEIINKIEKKPYDFTYETREMLNMYFTFTQELKGESTYGS